jgi:hypothetical protein
VKDHTTPTLIGAARAVRTSLAQLRNSPTLIFSPTLRAAVPQLVELLECLEDVGDRVTLIEASIERFEDRLSSIDAQFRADRGMGGAVETWDPTLTEPATMPSLDYDFNKLDTPA